MTTLRMTAGLILLAGIAADGAAGQGIGAAVPLAAGATVDAAAQSIRDNANAITQQLEQSFGVSSFRARQDIAFLIAEIDHVAERQRGRLMRDLNRQERQLFVDANNLVLAAGKQAGTTIADAQKVAQTVESGLSRLPLADRSPRVLRAAPAYLVTQPAGGTVSVDVAGSQLASGPGQLRIAQQSCTPTGQTEVALSFQCPAALFRTNAAAPKTVTAELAVPMPRSWWDWLLGRKADIKSYRIRTIVVPGQLGSYTIEGAYRFEERLAVERSGLIDAANPHCAGERTHGPFRFSPASGYQLDPQSIRLGDVHSSNRQVDILGPNDVASSGFYYHVKLKNGGDCVKVLGKTVSYDARAWRNQSVLWTDFKMVESEKPLQIAGGAVLWGKDIAIPLPENVSWIRLTVNQIDGESRVITDRSEANQWFAVDLDSERRNLVLRPRTLSTALGAP